MRFFIDSFDPDAEAELDALLDDPRWEVEATQLLARIGHVLATGLEDRELLVDWCKDWSELFVRRVGTMTAVFRFLGSGKRGSVMHVLSVNLDPKQAMADAKKRC